METLSDDIREITDMDIGGDYLGIQDVKEFIKELKIFVPELFHNKINELAGDALVGVSEA